jgi:two-component system chemotaxis response regulator CheY
MKRCLIVDDDREDRRIAAQFMRRFGFEVAVAENGDDALTMCRAKMPDFILLDHVMPKVDGLEFLKRLRRTRGGERPIVVFCSGRSDSETLSTAIWQGAAECLVKPFDADLLGFKLQQVGAMAHDMHAAA